MYELDKEKFGAFVAALRKEKGYTQKELADKPYISNKAVSKWETAVSIPDISLLVPLAEALDVSVTELLRCQRLPVSDPMDSHQVEELVKTAITYSEGAQAKRSFPFRRFLVWLLCVAIAAFETAAVHFAGYVSLTLDTPLATVLVLCPIFGLYFMVFATETLPQYYDDYRITSFSDGPMRMNLPGVRISNRNWPHILQVGRIWSMGMLIGYPLLVLGANLLAPELWVEYEKHAMLILMLGGLLAPMVIVGKKFA